MQIPALYARNARSETWRIVVMMQISASIFDTDDYTTPWSTIALATFRKPAMFAPLT